MCLIRWLSDDRDTVEESEHVRIFFGRIECIAGGKIVFIFIEVGRTHVVTFFIEFR